MVDLGHGTGRGIVAASLVYGGSIFSQILGIEIVPELYQISKTTTSQEYIASHKDKIDGFLHIKHNSGYTSSNNDGSKVREEFTVTEDKKCDIFISLGDFLSTERLDGVYREWTDADIVFANSTCFSYDLIVQISSMAEKLRPGTIFISLTQSLPSPCFEIIHQYTLPMSWGAATCFIQQRLP